jgi:diacylglycerol kinase (ATP)
MKRRRPADRTLPRKGAPDREVDAAAAHGESPFKSRGGAARIAEALSNSLSGFRIAFRIEAAFRQELALVAVLTVVLLALPFSTLERLLLALSMSLVLIVELVNSALEAAIDRISLEDHPLSKRAKDLGSAAVFLSLAFSGACWTALAAPLLSRMTW